MGIKNIICIIIFGFIILFSVGVTFLLYVLELKNRIKELKIRNKSLETQNNVYKDDNEQLYRTANSLNYKLEEKISEISNLKAYAYRLESLVQEKSTTTSTTNKDVLEAVRKAMIYSHPDKGICSTSDDFIKYKKLYDTLKGDNNHGKQHY